MNFVTLRSISVAIVFLVSSSSVPCAPPRPEQVSQGLAGYIHMNVPPATADGEFGYGVSFYSTAWPLLETPLADFQIGLPSTWIIPDNRGYKEPLCPIGTIARDHWPERGPSYGDVFQTIEGGLGFWASTQFGSATAKYRINGTSNCYNHEISSPGFGFGRTDALSAKEMGIAQLSNRLLVPPDGLTFETGTNGEVFGNAWMALPLVPAREKRDAADAPTGDQSWTLFVRATNYKGPLAFFIPSTWSAIAKGNDNALHRTLDARAGLMSGGAMEVNTVPRFVATDAKGKRYSKVPRLQFPVDAEGNSVLMQDVAMYSKAALFLPFTEWLSRGRTLGATFAGDAAYVPECTTDPIELRQGEGRVKLAGFDSIVETKMLGAATFGLAWKSKTSRFLSAGGVSMASFPEYFAETGEGASGPWTAIPASDVPRETHLVESKFAPASKGRPYESPIGKPGVWSEPGPKAGPFHKQLSDGSTVTYYWYRFSDQPAMRALEFTTAERDAMQAIAVRVHEFWAKSDLTLPPPSRGKLATLDPALLVTPPIGLEAGYVPIVTGQAAR